MYCCQFTLLGRVYIYFIQGQSFYSTSHYLIFAYFVFLDFFVMYELSIVHNVARPIRERIYLLIYFVVYHVRALACVCVVIPNNGGSRTYLQSMLAADVHAHQM